jgi:hypothetical protein
VTYSLNISLDEEFMSIPDLAGNHLLALTIYILEDGANKTTTITMTTTSPIATTSMLSTALDYELEDLQSSTIDPAKLLILLNSIPEPTRMDWLGILIRLLLLLLLLTLIGKILHCIFGRSPKERSRQKSSYTINLL